MLISFLSFISFLLISNKLFANPIACPVCAVAIVGGLSISRMLGVSDMIIGVWVGAILLAISQWTVYFFEKRKIKNLFVSFLCYILSYSLIIPLYFGSSPDIIYNLNRFCGVDAFLLSILIGSAVLFASVKLYNFMKETNGGKPHFQFEKVVLPISSLILTSLILYIITKA